MRKCTTCGEKLLPSEYKENKVKYEDQHGLLSLITGMRQPHDDECFICFAKENDRDRDAEPEEHDEFIDDLKRFRKKKFLELN
jgi:hypothetical protein